jgi:ribosomal protein S18
MPVKIRRRGSRYQVTDAGRVTARSTTKTRASRQARLLRAVTHGWKPTRRRR